MRTRKCLRRVFGALVLPAAVLSAAVFSPGTRATAAAPDWPQFHGPNRDARCAETGLSRQWPEDGPKLLWKIEGLGKGYSSVSIAGGVIFTMGDRETSDDSELQCVIAIDVGTRQERWSTPIGPPHKDGPRCTPTLDGELLYVVGTGGDLVCMERAGGGVRWKKNFAEDFGGKMMSGWKYSESPLVDGEKLVCTPGGKEATIVALNKATGDLIWKCAVPELGSEGKDGAGYSSMVAAEIDGVGQYIQILGRGAVGVAAESGEFLWGYNRVANSVANIPTPVVRANHVFVTTSYKSGGSALLKVTRRGDAFEAKEVYWHSPKEFDNHHGGVVLIGDYLYGGDGLNQGAPVCLEFLTGKIVWKAEAPAGGSAAVLYADGHLIFRYDKGPVYLAEATPEAFKIKGTFTPVKDRGPAWSHPVIHDGKLYLRHSNVLACYDVRESG